MVAAPRAASELMIMANYLAVTATSLSPTDKVSYRVGGLRVINGSPVATVTTRSPIWHIIEFGSAKYAGVASPPYRLVTRAAESAGLIWVGS